MKDKPVPDPTREQFHALLRKAAATQVAPVSIPAPKDRPASSSAPQADETSDA